MARRREPAELRRRAEVLARYVKLARPSERDDQAFAAELGLSVDSLLRLSAAWRLRKEPTSLMGAGLVFEQLRGAEGWDVPLSEIDVSEVLTSRVKETIRRIGVVQDFLRIATPTTDDLEMGAAAIGVSRQAFRRMVRLWLLHRRAAAMPGAGRTSLGRRRTHAGRRAKELAVALRKAMPNQPVAMVHAALVTGCAREGLRPPSAPTLYRWLANDRRSSR